MPPSRNQILSQMPVSMDYVVRNAHAGVTKERIPQSLPSCHPGYGAGVEAALDERLAEELAAKNTHYATAAGSTSTPAATTTTSKHALTLSEIDVRLATARNKTKAAKAMYEAALAAERGLERQKDMALKSVDKVKILQGIKEEKLRRRERAFESARGGAAAGAKPVGVRKVVLGKAAGPRKPTKYLGK